jgi:hypothetical protein
MNLTHHARQRMSQRGIPSRLVDFALRHGRIEGDRHVLDRKESLRVMDALMDELRTARRILDKGGITVVEDHGAVITTFNREQPVHRPRPARGLAQAERHV